MKSKVDVSSCYVVAVVVVVVMDEGRREGGKCDLSGEAVFCMLYADVLARNH